MSSHCKYFIYKKYTCEYKTISLWISYLGLTKLIAVWARAGRVPTFFVWFGSLPELSPELHPGWWLSSQLFTQCKWVLRVGSGHIMYLNLFHNSAIHLLGGMLECQCSKTSSKMAKQGYKMKNTKKTSGAWWICPPPGVAFSRLTRTFRIFKTCLVYVMWPLVERWISLWIRIYSF